ncbi:MAG TPA: GAP family protein [Acidimicrobiales bacterium]
MRQVIGEILPFAVIVMVSPINIVAAILLLFSKRPLANASCYLGGFVAGVAVVVGGITALAGAIHLDPGSDRSRGASALLLALGVWLIIRAVQKFRGRAGQDGKPSLPGWMDGIAGFGPGRSLAVGAGIGAGNPKNIAVAMGTAVAVSSSGLPVGQQVVVLAIYVVLASLGVAAPIVAMLVLGDRSDAVLDGWRSWLTRNNAAMMAVIYLFLGVYLIGQNLGGA